ncbi:DUF1624 domain-containing protein [Shimwellia pseudoproteus]|uniref:DUF1624 domain-containing protein n=1 Tax=Shimwellia pseudoproteus TaxID=570012 RepID=UPI0018EDCF7A|nr:heparan-alpha-glucosaminide N-acetyltransferase domain-containing protein [Shimwellia pseudoproteus]MBJ3815706.1 DUF1624 domain-containing protein [Shimwellia pseudoproteus]
MSSALFPGSSPVTTQRLIAIDALRGLMMLLMLVDHLRETFYLQMPVSDPMDITSTSAGLFLIRTLSHLCAPVFLFLTGLSAALYYQQTASRTQTAAYLLKRGLFLILLDITVVNFAATFQLPPPVIHLQILSAIGLSMVIMSALLFIPRAVVLLLALIVIGGHNLLDAVQLPDGSDWAIPLQLLHRPGWITLSDSLRLRIDYPLLPWPAVMALGFCTGPWFASLTRETRTKRLIGSGVLLLLVFFAVRVINGYGEAPWHSGASLGETAMGFFNVTKYPPSLAFCSLTLGVGLLLLALFDQLPKSSWLVALAGFGAAPLFFYLVHLYLLRGLYMGAVMLWGDNHGDIYGVDQLGRIWMMTAILVMLLFKPVQEFAGYKMRRRDIRWLKYF